MVLNMAKWGQGPFLGLDFESTAADPLQARPIQYCLSYVQRNENGKFDTDTVTSYVNPGVEIPPDSFKIHGISQDVIESKGEDPKHAVEAITAAIKHVTEAGGAIVIMNASYDLTLLDREASRQGVVPISEMMFNGTLGEVAPVLDPMVIDKRFNKIRKRVSDKQGPWCLKTIAGIYGLPWDDSKAHDAEYDTLQTVRVIVRMASVVMADISTFINRGWKKDSALRAIETREFTEQQMHERQREWAKVQAEDLKKYFIKVGKLEAADSIRGEWPYVKPSNGELF